LQLTPVRALLVALPDSQPAASNHWRHKCDRINNYTATASTSFVL